MMEAATQVCTRTADMPGYVDELVDHGVSHVFLEKPGAPTVEELGRMKDDCAAKGATIWMGFNKNVTAYVTKGREALAKVPGGDFTLVHHNAYKANELGECFERNAEGMLKNMAIHELALLVTFFGVNSDTLSDVVADKAYSDLRTEKGPSSGSDFTDFSRIGFTVTTKAGAKVSVYADRCGLELPDGAMADGGMMYSSVSKLGIIQSRDIMPDADLVATVEARSKENPDWMPYFHLQHDDYITLKERCTAHIASGQSGDPEGIATIQVGYDTLKLAEALKPLLEKQLL
jgi:predicted dehydrogenase